MIPVWIRSMTVSFLRSLPTFLGDIHRSRHARRETPKRDALARRAREILVPSAAGDSLRENYRPSLSLSLPFRFFSLRLHRTLSLAHLFTLLPCRLVSPLLLSFSLCPQVFLPRRSFSPPLSSFPLQIQFFLPLLVSPSIFLFFFSPSFPAVATSACHVTALWRVL